MKLVLGTAQFGSDYGIANKSGRIPVNEIAPILSFAKKMGVHTLDTAVSYGDSESVLGENCNIGDWRIITKLPSLPDECEDIYRWILCQVTSSLSRLKVNALHGLLLHKPLQILGPRGREIFSAISDLRDLGLIKKIGISVYSPAEVESIFQLYKFDIVQCPFNLLDQRMLESDLLFRLKDWGVEVYTRSTFLQGVLLMTLDEQLFRFGKWPTIWFTLAEWLQVENLTPLEACLQYPASISEIDGVIVGIDGLSQLQEITRSYRETSIGIPKFGKIDERLINPSYWQNL